MRELASHLALCLVPWSSLVPSEAFAQDPPLVVRTTQPQIARQVCGALRVADSRELPLEESVPAGNHFVIRLGADHRVDIRTARGAPFLELVAEPPPLLAMFSGEVEQGRIRARAMLGLAYGAIGLDYDDVAKIVDAVFAFPEQIARVRLSIPDQPDEQQPLQARLDLEPREGTWFAKLVAALQAPEAGFRRLDGESPMLDATVCIDVARVYPLLEPLLAPFARAWTRDGEERERSLDVLRRTVATYDRTSWIGVDATTGLRLVIGLADPHGYRELMRDPGFLETQERAAEAGGQAEASLRQDAFEHRGVAMDSLDVHWENPLILPWADSDGALETRFGVAGSHLLSMNGSDEAVTAAIDELLDSEARSSKLPERTFVVMHLQPSRIYEQFALQALDGALPNDVSLSVFKSRANLSFALHAR